MSSFLLIAIDEQIVSPEDSAVLRRYGIGLGVRASQAPNSESAQSLPQRKPSFALQNPQIFGKLQALSEQLRQLTITLHLPENKNRANADACWLCLDAARVLVKEAEQSL